ncbi:MAG: hypothetical protein IT178_16725 [Acidobacteria bacterium]|nr:hypothetical protein [Acidobacteriota bacterium]
MTHDQAIATHAAERYLLEEMPELERFQFEAHYFDCETCAEDVRTGAMMAEGVKDGLLPAVAPGPSTIRPLVAVTTPASVARAAWKTVLPWAVAATLAVAVGYQSFVPGEASLTSQAVTPITLRAATRGPDPVVTATSSGVHAFALDVNTVAAGTRLSYDLRTADGVSVVTGTADAPTPGAPLLVLVPGAALPAAGTYTLTVRAADGSNAAASDYRFVISN